MLFVIWSTGCFDADEKDISDEEPTIPMKVETMTGEDGNHGPFEYSSHLVDPDIGTQYLLLVKNVDEGNDSFIFKSNAPTGWNVVFFGGNELNEIPGGEWGYKIVTITTSMNEKDTYQEIKIVATSTTDSSRFGIITTKNTIESLSPEEADLDKHPIIVDYNLVFYGGGEDQNEYGWYHNQGSEFEASDNMVIIGFEEGIKGMREGQSRVVEIPPEKGYGEYDEKHVGGRPLVFEIKMLDVNTEN